MSDNDNGSFAGGLLLGFFLGIVGAIIAFAINKYSTRKGAGVGIILRISIPILTFIIMAIIGN